MTKRWKLSIKLQEVWLCLIICLKYNEAGSALLFRIRFILYICLLSGQRRKACVQVLKQPGSDQYIGKYLCRQISTRAQYDMKGGSIDRFIDSFIYLDFSSHLEMALHIKVTFVEGKKTKQIEK